MRKRGIRTGLGLMSGVWASACAPNTQFKSLSNLDASKEVNARSAGINTNSSDGSAKNGRLNVDCFLQSVDAGKHLGENPLKSIGIPSNCPVEKGTATESTGVLKSDVAVVLDTSENMLKFEKVAKSELAAALNKLHSEGRIATLSAVAFRTKVTVSENGEDIAKTIGLITGSSADWSPNPLKTIDPKRTDWITGEAAKDVFTALQNAAAALTAGSQKSKILIVINNSTGSGQYGYDVGPAAKIISELDASVSKDGGVLTFNYAASDELATSLPDQAPTPLKQLDMLSSAAAIKPVRSLFNERLGGWGESILTRSRISTSATEACVLKRLEGSDSGGTPIFKKDFSISDKNGFQDVSMPQILEAKSFKMVITRRCDKSGETHQSVTVTAAQGGQPK